MSRKWKVLLSAAAGVAIAGFSSYAAAVEGADFDREVARVNARLRLDANVSDPAAGTVGQVQGLTGPAAEEKQARDVRADSGSAKFDRYVEQVNRQLRMRAELDAD